MYAYVANNPTTWVDPGGNQTGVETNPLAEYDVQAAASAVAFGEAAAVSSSGLVPLTIGCACAVAAAILVCAMIPACHNTAIQLALIILRNGAEIAFPELYITPWNWPPPVTLPTPFPLPFPLPLPIPDPPLPCIPPILAYASGRNFVY